MPTGREVVAELKDVLPLLGTTRPSRVGERGDLVRLSWPTRTSPFHRTSTARRRPGGCLDRPCGTGASGTLRLIARFLQGRSKPRRCSVCVRPASRRRCPPVRLEHLIRHGRSMVTPPSEDRSSDPSGATHRHRRGPGRPGRCRRRTTCARIVHSATGRPVSAGPRLAAPGVVPPERLCHVRLRYVDSPDTRPTKCTPHGCRGSGWSTPPEASAGASRPFWHAGPRPRSWRLRPACSARRVDRIL